MPGDAVLEGVIPLTARAPGAEGATVGYLIRYTRRVEGRAVRGNRIADHLAVVVGSAGVLAWSMYWPEVEVGFSPGESPALLSAGEALLLAADAISRAAKGEVRLDDARPVLGTLGPSEGPARLVPAWELEGASGDRVVVDAATGQPLL